MPNRTEYDAVVVGSGLNGLAAAITIARQRRSVLVVEANDTIGGGTRSEALTLPGFIHDTCSTVQALTSVSPFFRSIPLADYGVELVYPAAAVAHPLDDGGAAVLYRSTDATGATLGPDAAAYRRLYEPLVQHADELNADLLGPFPFPPRHPLLFARFGAAAWLPARRLAELMFRGEHARALFAGIAAHAMLPLESLTTAAYALALGVAAHASGWPIVKGGSRNLADALAAYLRSLEGEVVTGWRVKDIDELPAAKAYLFDVTPHQLVSIAGKRLPNSYLRALTNFRYGPGVFKVDFALSQPVPWKAEGCATAGTVHLGGTLGEVAAGEREVSAGRVAERPFTLVVQPTLFDPSRAPAGKHTLWAYCHVPNGSTCDMTENVIAQIERFAPGFRECVIAKHVIGPAAMEAHNANYIGGDINGGAQDIWQLYTRPVARRVPYSTPAKGIYICSSSTPPGGGVHGMCGFHAARAAIKACGL
jgi:phytoene dehydrogenase-like protein